MSITTDLRLGRAEVVSGLGNFPNRKIAGGGENELLAFNTQPTGTVISRWWGKGNKHKTPNKQTTPPPPKKKKRNKNKQTKKQNQPTIKKKKKKKKQNQQQKGKKEEKRTHAVNNLRRKCCSHYWKMELWGKE